MTTQVKLLLCLVGAAGIAVGVVIGGYAAFRFGTRFIANTTIDRESGSALFALSSIEKLRNNDNSGVLELSEQYLDSAVVSLGGNLQQVPQGQAKSRAMRVLKKVEEYRERYPRKTSFPAVDDAVKEALSIPNK